MPRRPRGRSVVPCGALVAYALLGEARAACPVDSASLEASLDAVVDAFARMDVEGFYARRDEARSRLPCLDQAIAPPLAGAYHRMEALNAFLGRDTPAVVASFRAAFSADPDTALPEGLAIEGNPLFDAFQEARAAPPSATEVARAEGTLVVDGHTAEAVPVERPSVVQVVADTVRTAYVADAGAFPEWIAVGAPEPVVVLPAPLEPVPSKRATVPLVVATSVTVALAGGLLGGGLYERGRFRDPATPFEDLDGHRTRANGLGVAAQISAGFAVGLGGIALYEGIR